MGGPQAGTALVGIAPTGEVPVVSRHPQAPPPWGNVRRESTPPLQASTTTGATTSSSHRCGQISRERCRPCEHNKGSNNCCPFSPSMSIILKTKVFLKHNTCSLKPIFRTNNLALISLLENLVVTSYVQRKNKK